MNSKISKSEIQNFLRTKLATNQAWSRKALLKIYENQTADEQQMETTAYTNGIGFTGVDAQILSSFASQLIRKDFLSPKQQAIVFKKLPKYWRQILKISDEQKIHNLLISERIKLI